MKFYPYKKRGGEGSEKVVAMLNGSWGGGGTNSFVVLFTQ